MKTKRRFISIQDLNPQQIEEIFDLTGEVKLKGRDYGQPLKNTTLILAFQKPSNRTRVSFEVGMNQLGGHSIYLSSEDIKLGTRESMKDVSRVLSRYGDAIVARTFSHADILEMARWATVPVINGLSDLLHPCQGLADLFTIREKLGCLKGIKIAFVGDGNNVLHSLMYGCAKMGTHLVAATPPGYKPKKEIVHAASKEGSQSKAKISIIDDPREAVKEADVIYTDVWTSMGQEGEREKRLKDFKPFQVNQKLLSYAKKGCLVMHCLPAHRGEEITDYVLDVPQSVVLDQAENRMHVQKAILLLLLDHRK